MSDNALLPEIRRFDDAQRLALVRADSITLVDDTERRIAVDQAVKNATNTVLLHSSELYEQWNLRGAYEALIEKVTVGGDGQEGRTEEIVQGFAQSLRGKADQDVSDREARRRLTDLHGAVNHSLVDLDEQAAPTPVIEIFSAITQARRRGEALDTSLVTAASLAQGIQEAETAQEAEDLRYRLWYLLNNQEQRFDSVEAVHEWRDEFLRTAQFRQDARITATLFGIASHIMVAPGRSIVTGLEERYDDNIRQLKKLARFDTSQLPPNIDVEGDKFLDVQFEVIIESLERIISGGTQIGSAVEIIRLGLERLIEGVEGQVLDTRKIGALILSMHHVKVQEYEY